LTASRTGVPSLYVEHINLNAYNRTRLWWKMDTETPQIPRGLSNSGNRRAPARPGDTCDAVAREAWVGAPLEPRPRPSVWHAPVAGGAPPTSWRW